MLRRALAIGPFVALALALACASPTLPLPPPLLPTVGQGADADHVKLSAPCGGAQGGATIVVENSNAGVPGDQRIGGAVASNCGSWDSTVYAHKGDYLNVTQEIGTEVSSPTVVQVP